MCRHRHAHHRQLSTRKFWSKPKNEGLENNWAKFVFPLLDKETKDSIEVQFGARNLLAQDPRLMDDTQPFFGIFMTLPRKKEERNYIKKL